MPCQVWRRWTYPLPYYCCWYITLRCDLELWPWTFAAYRLWRDETLYQISTQSNNRRRSYSDLSVWPNDLEHVLSVALDSGIIFTESDHRQLIRAWIIAFFYADTLSSCDLNLWPLTLKVRGRLQVLRDQSLYKIWAKSNNIPWLSYRRFSAFSRAIIGYGHRQNWQSFLRSAWTQLHQTWPGHGWSS